MIDKLCQLLIVYLIFCTLEAQAAASAPVKIYRVNAREGAEPNQPVMITSPGSRIINRYDGSGQNLLIFISRIEKIFMNKKGTRA